MSDILEAILPGTLGHIKPPEGICSRCQGVLPGYIGYEGEWPCLCGERLADQAVDNDIERMRLERKERNEDAKDSVD